VEVKARPAGQKTGTKAESSGEDPRATGGLVSNLPHPRVNETKQHTVFGGGMVTSGQQNKATHTHKTKSENDACHIHIFCFSFKTC